MANNWRDINFISKDGLNLYARDYGPQDGSKMPVLCLAGLTRNCRDFHVLASRLAQHRRVIVPDYRGRGRSDYAEEWQTYEPDVEMDDAITLLDKIGIDKFVIVGTSRGGLIAMLMASFHKHRLAGIVLNDIGPKLEDDGLIEIADSIRTRTKITSWDSLVEGLKAYHSGITGLSDEKWLEFAHNCYIERNREIVPDYDFNLTKTFPSAELVKAGKIPQVWELFSAIEPIPCAVIRGENSDLLSDETVEKMKTALPGLITALVKERGHVPFLDEAPALDAIDQVLAIADQN